MTDLKQLRIIEQISRECIDLLDSIWAYGIDVRFSNTIKLLQDNLKYCTQFTNQYSRVLLYQITFNINTSKAKEIGPVAQTGVNHVTDSWKLLLLEINSNSQRFINTILIKKQRELGLYIKTLQDAFTRRNKMLLHNRKLVKSLTELLKDIYDPIVSIDSKISEAEYEVLASDEHTSITSGITTYLTNWF